MKHKVNASSGQGQQVHSNMISTMVGSIILIAALYLGRIDELILKFFNTANSSPSQLLQSQNNSTNTKVYTQQSMQQEMNDRSTEDDKYLLLSLAGHVFDVSAGSKHYGEGGGYSFFVGGDYTRAYATGDFSSEGVYHVMISFFSPHFLCCMHFRAH